jgi:hypothetical protein
MKKRANSARITAVTPSSTPMPALSVSRVTGSPPEKQTGHISDLQ